MKRNVRKCYLLISSSENVRGNIVTLQIKNVSCKRLLGVDIYYKLSFENLIIQIYARISPFLNKGKKILINAFFRFRFTCFSLSRMLCSRKLSNKM